MSAAEVAIWAVTSLGHWPSLTETLRLEGLRRKFSVGAHPRTDKDQIKSFTAGVGMKGLSYWLLQSAEDRNSRRSVLRVGSRRYPQKAINMDRDASERLDT